MKGRNTRSTPPTTQLGVRSHEPQTSNTALDGEVKHDSVGQINQSGSIQQSQNDPIHETNTRRKAVKRKREAKALPNLIGDTTTLLTSGTTAEVDSSPLSPGTSKTVTIESSSLPNSLANSECTVQNAVSSTLQAGSVSDIIAESQPMAKGKSTSSRDSKVSSPSLGGAKTKGDKIRDAKSRKVSTSDSASLSRSVSATGSTRPRFVPIKPNEIIEVQPATAALAVKKPAPVKKAPKRPKTKRKKREPVEKTKEVKIRRNARLGRLERFQFMPVEILHEIMSYLPPVTLLKLVRLTKALRGILLSKNSAHLWRASLQREGLETFSATDLNPVQWSSILFDKSCAYCGRSRINRLAPLLRERLCDPCLKIHLSSGTFGGIRHSTDLKREAFRPEELTDGQNGLHPMTMQCVASVSIDEHQYNAGNFGHHRLTFSYTYRRALGARDRNVFTYGGRGARVALKSQILEIDKKIWELEQQDAEQHRTTTALLLASFQLPKNIGRHAQEDHGAPKQIQSHATSQCSSAQPPEIGTVEWRATVRHRRMNYLTQREPEIDPEEEEDELGPALSAMKTEWGKRKESMIEDAAMVHEWLMDQEIAKAAEKMQLRRSRHAGISMKLRNLGAHPEDISQVLCSFSPVYSKYVAQSYQLTERVWKNISTPILAHLEVVRAHRVKWESMTPQERWGTAREQLRRQQEDADIWDHGCGSYYGTRVGNSYTTLLDYYSNYDDDYDDYDEEGSLFDWYGSHGYDEEENYDDDIRIPSWMMSDDDGEE